MRYFVCLLFALFLVYPSVSAQEDQLSQMSLNIRQTLSTLRTQSITLQEQLSNTTARLQVQYQNLKLSEQELQRLTELSNSLQSSLTNTIEQSQKWYESSEKYRQQLQERTKLLFILAGILVLRLAGMLAGYFLYAKGIHLPRWLDILL